MIKQEKRMLKNGRFRTAKTREWTDQEVQEAADFVRGQRPDVWENLLKIERTTGDYQDQEETHVEVCLLFQLHPECELNEITQLFLKLRAVRRLNMIKKGN